MTKSELIRELKSIHGHLKKARDRAEKVSIKIDVPSYNELYFITQEVEQLLEMSKQDKSYSKENK